MCGIDTLRVSIGMLLARRLQREECVYCNVFCGTSLHANSRLVAFRVSARLAVGGFQGVLRRDEAVPEPGFKSSADDVPLHQGGGRDVRPR